jgi:hypothetical protein
MKNLFLLPTDKPSRLFEDDLQLYYSKDKNRIGSIISNKHIYITSDEEIKDVRPNKGKWHLEKGNVLNKFPDYLTDLSECKLVIMTTDPQLIADGVQAIDDDFLKWFVKNPSCQKILIGIEIWNDGGFSYRIIIPKEEPKQVWKQIIETCGGKEAFMESAGLKPKQETLEEVAENNYYFESDIEMVNFISEMASTGKIPNRWSAFVAKINELYLFKQEQDKNKYSEEIIDILDNVRYWETCPDEYKVIIEKFIEQFKKINKR